MANEEGDVCLGQFFSPPMRAQELYAKKKQHIFVYFLVRRHEPFYSFPTVTIYDYIVLWSDTIANTRFHGVWATKYQPSQTFWFQVFWCSLYQSLVFRDIAVCLSDILNIHANYFMSFMSSTYITKYRSVTQTSRRPCWCTRTMTYVKYQLMHDNSGQ